MNKKYILLIEDNESIRKSLVWALEEESYPIITASNGKLALNLLEKEPLPSLIILDLMMPEMDGWTFRDQQKRNARTREIPTIITSARNRLDEILHHFPNELLLPKPFDMNHLLAIIEQKISFN
ncbi:response regulator [Legionella parisiensis]|uniref:Putative transcriptional regulatory protein YedW n=1 Tax=Legionella parisiensis TaxID=45071 RepID=A0A1E5JLA3_9GAMM|nr:response regulator [Legionella parisiensis]KTD40612.1 two-component response regulator [Legionella parisiensis]OEH45336.1 putative transcriptional regulatory protein YedW [Legionella parisiensis]STX76995.1 two-component response regulator [Legionella parisiensis]